MAFAKIFLKEDDAAVVTSRDDMNRIAMAVLEFQVDFGEYPDSLQQLTIIKIDSTRLLCPITQKPYSWTKTESGWEIKSPVGHGSIRNGIASW